MCQLKLQGFLCPRMTLINRVLKMWFRRVQILPGFLTLHAPFFFYFCKQIVTGRWAQFCFVPLSVTIKNHSNRAGWQPLWKCRRSWKNTPSGSINHPKDDTSHPAANLVVQAQTLHSIPPGLAAPRVAMLSRQRSQCTQGWIHTHSLYIPLLDLPASPLITPPSSSISSQTYSARTPTDQQPTARQAEGEMCCFFLGKSS